MMRISLKISDNKLTEITYEFNILKKLEIRTERSLNSKKPTG
jgi:hypothetical protein